MNERILYENAVAHFNKLQGVDISNAYTKQYKEELIYCYLQDKSLVDFDFWTRYEELLEEPIRYDEYLFLDSKYEGDPYDIKKEDDTYDTILYSLRKNLRAYRKENEVVGTFTLYSLSTITEMGDGIRDFNETNVSLGSGLAKEAFLKEKVTNPHVLKNGISRETKESIESNYVNGEGFCSFTVTQKEVPFTRAQLKDLLLTIDKDILREVLPKDVKAEGLCMYLEDEVPKRFYEIQGYDIPRTEKTLFMDVVPYTMDLLFKKGYFDGHLKSIHEEFLKNKTWISVYKDTLGYYDDFDNLTDILVPTDWLKAALKEEGVTDFEDWLLEYTADSTMDIAYRAIKDGVILDCMDEEIPLKQEKTILATKKKSLYESISSAKEEECSSTKHPKNKEAEFER